MVSWNPSFPEVLGNEWLINVGVMGRVWAGAPAVMARMQSTVAETITTLKLSATVNPLLQESAPTVVDVFEEGNEETGLYKLASLVPNSDKLNEGWVTQAGSSASLFTSIDEDATRWPGPAQFTWIQTTSPLKAYACSVDATSFAPAGANQNARVGFVEVRGILGANTGFRKLAVVLQIGGNLYQPAGGSIRDVHGYGSMFTFWWGELNPATGLPWTPAAIADFGTAGSSRIFVRSYNQATTAQFPKVWALRLHVYHQTVDNRVAVGVWRRPEALTARLTNVSTDALLTLPSGAANWSKLSGRNYLFYWRQSVSPSEYGPVVADDIRWNIVRQHLGPAGQPPDYSFAPAGNLAATGRSHDQFGRPEGGFSPDSGKSAMGLAMVRSDAAISTDSQPYRLDLTDIVPIRSTQKVGQRVTPSSTNTYLGVRFVVIPPPIPKPPSPPGNPTLTAAVIRISDSVQMGGTFTITADAVRALPAAIGGWRYVTGFLASGASLASGIPYEIRLSTTASTTDWLAAMPDSSLGETASFGGSTSGAFIGATHITTRDLSINLVRQPNPVTSPTATLTNVAVTAFSDTATTVPHVNVAWTAPASGMGASFARYELERQTGTGPWQRIADITNPATVTFTDREAARTVTATYRIRCVGIDGRFSAYATTSAVTPTDPRAMLILSSNHDTALYFVHLYELTDTSDGETVYPMLSASHDETVAIHGADYQVVFMEAETRGTGWRTRVSLKQTTMTTKGLAKFDSLTALVRSLNIPYVCALDHQGNRIYGHVSVTEGVQTQPDYRFTALLEITPTHSEPIPVAL